MKFFFSAFLCSLLTTPSFGAHNQEWGWGKLGVSLPKALSDHAVSISNGIIYIAGGCDFADGNKFNKESEWFECGSITDSFYAFDPEDEDFEELPPLPRARYRHSSAIVNNQVWITGGRTLDEKIIPEADVYDIETKEWTTYMLPESAQVSDQASFAEEPFYLYIVGGYDQNYTSLTTVSKIVVSEASTDSTLKVEEAAPLNIGRGDIIATVSTDGKHAFVGGGFGNENGWCQPLISVEEYSFSEDKWAMLPDLVNERAEIVLVELDNHLYGLGGERPIEGMCDITEDIDPGQLTVGTELVEVYERSSTKNEWEVLASIPDHKFRFQAVGFEDKELIYTFGGQISYNEACQCFKTTDEIEVFGKGVSAGSVISVGFGLLVSFFSVALFV